MGFTTDLSHDNDAEQIKETNPHCTCLSAMLESAGLIFCALCNVSAYSEEVFGGCHVLSSSLMQLLTSGCLTPGLLLCY